MIAVLDSAHRLYEAICMIEANWNRSEGIHPDLDPEYEAIQAWFWVPNLYQLIEQSFKLLLWHRNQTRSRIHRLSSLYCSLDCKYQTMLSDAYRSYHDLHNYLPDESLESFLRRADRGKCRETGYTTWRYMLIEEFPSQEKEIPMIHIGAMLDVLIAARQIMHTEIIRNQKITRIETIDLRLRESLIDVYNSIAIKYCSWDEIQAQVQNESGVVASDTFNRIKYCRDLLSRNLYWARDYMTSSFRLELSQENTAIMAAICKKMMEEHKHDFLQYMNRLVAGELRLPDVP